MNRPLNEHSSSRDVYIVDGLRTPFLKTAGRPGPFTPVDLAVQAGRPLLMKYPEVIEAIDQVVLGCVNVIATEMNPARLASLRLGLSDSIPAHTVQTNCGSGMQAVDSAFRAISSGSAEVVLAGGTEALSHSPLLWPQQAVHWLADLAQARNFGERLGVIRRFRPQFLQPIIGLRQGLTDPIVSLNMGQTAEVLAGLFDISRAAADVYAVESHLRLAAAQETGILDDEVTPIFDLQGNAHLKDDGVRPDSSFKKLAKLRPVFEKPWGKVTAGNSSQVSDGASWLILASEAAVDRLQLKPLARLVDMNWAGLHPAVMGLGPVFASTPLITRHCDGDLSQIDLWELNEAFACQVLACASAWRQEAFCREYLNLPEALGPIDLASVNIDGGAISLGHPVGTSGNRIILHLAKTLARTGSRRGIATLCVGGGQGGAALLEVV